MTETTTLLEAVMMLHGSFVVFVFVTTMVSGIVVAVGRPREGTIRALKSLALLTALFVFAVNLTGIYGYMFYRLPVPESPRSIILEMYPFAHEVLFETMEYLSLVGLIWATLIAWLVGHYKARALEEPALRRGTLILIVLGTFWLVWLIFSGIIPTLIEVVR